MYQFPIKYYEDNLIINKSSKDCWAVYQMVGFNYDFLSADRKVMLLNRISRFISAIGTEAKILILPVEQDVGGHYKNLRAGFDQKDPLHKYAITHAAGCESYLREKTQRDGNVNDYDTYIVVKLTRPKGLSSILDELIKRPAKTIEELFSVDYKELLVSELNEFNAVAQSWYNEQNSRIRLVKTDADKTQWLIRRMFRRGINEPVKIRSNKGGEAWSPYKENVLRDGEKAIRPHEKDVLSLTEAMIEPGRRYITITGSDGKVSYQTFLTMAHIPDGMVFPGSEWLLVLQDYPIAAEVCMHIVIEDFRDAVKRISGKKREIKSQMEHVAESDEIPEDLFEAKETAEALEAELKSARDPLARTSVSICIASTDPQDLETKASFVKERYEDVNFAIERPMTDQFKLFMEFIPGAGRYATDYVMPLPPRTVAGSMFPATRQLGDNQGPFIGTTGILEKLVFLDMQRACRENRSASAFFGGTLGGGKSFNANLLTYLNVLYGGYGLILDPKGERSGWPEDIPELRDQTAVITLSAGKEDLGKLDPFLIYKDNMDMAGELALNVLSEIFRLNPQHPEYTAILEGINHVKGHSLPCMTALAGYLFDGFPEEDELRQPAHMIGRRINLLRDAGMAGLLFGTGSERGLNLDHRLNILQIQNLQLPDPSTAKEDYTQEETVSTVLMLPISSFADRFVSQSRDHFKIVLYDESWALSTTAQGVKMMNKHARLGRSLNAGCIFIGHSIQDLKGDGLKEAITYKFCFRSVDNNETKRVLDFLDLEETDENMKTIQQLGNGQCLFKDLDGRVGTLQWDAVYGHLINAFNTTPGWKKGE